MFYIVWRRLTTNRFTQVTNSTFIRLRDLVKLWVTSLTSSFCLFYTSLHGMLKSNTKHIHVQRIFRCCDISSSMWICSGRIDWCCCFGFEHRFPLILRGVDVMPSFLTFNEQLQYETSNKRGCFFAHACYAF